MCALVARQKAALGDIEDAITSGDPAALFSHLGFKLFLLQ